MSLAQRQTPVVGVLANRAFDGSLPAQAVDEKYLLALLDVAKVSTVIIPALGASGHLSELLDRIDGLVLTGAVSNVHPEHFAPDADAGLHEPFDAGRDHAALELIRLTLERDMPLLAICRGMQELNVACGGTLTPDIFVDGESFDHRPWAKDLPPEQLYGSAHDLVPVPGGWMDRLGLRNVSVNSVHVQAIDRLGEGLHVEAHARDGTIEAISLPQKCFALGVQWHPEYRADSNSFSRKLFEAFGDAVRQAQSTAAAPR